MTQRPSPTLLGPVGLVLVGHPVGPARRRDRQGAVRRDLPHRDGVAAPGDQRARARRRRATAAHRPDAARLAGRARLRRQPRHDELGDLPVLLPHPARHRRDDRVHRPADPGASSARGAPATCVWVLLAARRGRPPRLPADRARPASVSRTPCSPAPRGRRTSCSARAPGGGGRGSTVSPWRASSPRPAMTLPALLSAGTSLWDGRVLLIGALVGLLSSVIPYSCELVALRSLRPAVFGILMSLEPAAAALAAIVVLQEHLSPVQWLAIGCVVAASIGATRSGATPERATGRHDDDHSAAPAHWRHDGGDMRSGLALAALVLALGAATGAARAPTPSRSRSVTQPTDLPSQPTPTDTPSRQRVRARRRRPAPTGGPPEVVDTLVDRLEVPWGVDFLPDGDAVVTERISGRVLPRRRRTATLTPLGDGRRRRPPGRGRAPRRRRVPGLRHRPDALPLPHHRHRQPGRRAPSSTARRLGTPTVVLDGIPAGFIHDGGRIAFGPDGHLYVTTGETGDPELAQDPHSLAGKILRITARRRARPRQPRPRLPGLVARPPQRPGPGVGRRGAAVGLGVRRLRVGRAQPGREGRQLRLAARSRVPAATRRTSTRSSSGRSTRPRRAGWPSPTATCGWRACAASACGASRSPPTARRRSRGRSSPRSTGGCAPWPPHPTACSG